MKEEDIRVVDTTVFITDDFDIDWEFYICWVTGERIEAGPGLPVAWIDFVLSGDNCTDPFFIDPRLAAQPEKLRSAFVDRVILECMISDYEEEWLVQAALYGSFRPFRPE